MFPRIHGLIGVPDAREEAHERELQHLLRQDPQAQCLPDFQLS